MPLPIIANTIRATAVGHCANGHKWSNVLHFRKTGALTNAGAIAILDPLLLNHYTVAVAGGSGWKQVAPTQAGLELLEYTPLDGTTATTVVQHTSAGIDGGDPLPASVCLVITLRTALRGRAHRGRVYWGPHTEGQNLLGAPSAALVTQFGVQWTTFLTTLTGTGVSLVVASYLPSAPGAQDVIACTVDSRWDTQRRRLNV